MHIVIDGYNLIYQSKQFDRIRQADLQASREALIDALVVYKRLKPYKITVIFDGSMAATGAPRRDREKGIQVRYSSHGELADTVIKRMALREKENLLVVTSDNDIVRYVQARGATTISAREFEERMVMARFAVDNQIGEGDETEPWQATTRKKGPARRQPKRLRKLQRKLEKF
jgi:predicted RNA-binding protein with PIN domain